MSAEVKILDESVKEVVVLPMSVISFDDNNNAYVYIKDENKKVKRDLDVGITDGINVQIKKGISLDDEILLEKKEINNFGPEQFRENSNQNSYQNGSNINGG